MSWNEDAPCLNVPGFSPDDDPEVDDLAASEHVRWTYCAWCPLRFRCIHEAMRGAEPAGVWGGVPLSVRLRWRRQRRSIVCQCGEPLDPIAMLDDENLKKCSWCTKALDARH